MAVVFVYGSLKSGFHNEHVIREAKGTFFRCARTIDRFQLLSFGFYPGLVPGEKSITGELWIVPEKKLGIIDRLENVPFNYVPVRIPMSCGLVARGYMCTPEFARYGHPIEETTWHKPVSQREPKKSKKKKRKPSLTDWI